TPGSIGNLVFRGEVFKGKKLPGRTGGKRVSVKNLKVAKVDVESGHIFVSGAVPGKKGLTCSRS
ncbi:50S ribosomal protein L3, partial [Candidatus Babeliales bacterium]|nr:50S ribosomal protein L3 [Candidatus Babeliales bacterium]